MMSEFDNMWTDHYDTVDHMYKVQAARCNEFVIYLEALYVKYPDFWVGVSWWGCLKQRTHLTMVDSHDWIKKKFEVEVSNVKLTDTEKHVYLVKLKRIMDAKFDFELFRGEYKNYQ